ncbi:MAG TPA: hypothetical protein VF727_06555 [Allosphingosinicella sp.]|jgi:hypothetical protein
MYRWMAAVSALAVGAAALADVGGTGAADGATFEFRKGYKAEIPGGTEQVFKLQPTVESCKKLKRIALLDALSGQTKTVAVPAGKPINLYARVSANSRLGAAILTHSCAASVTFTPRPGGRYSVIQRVIRPVSCDLEVVDTSTGVQPTDLVVNRTRVCK